MAADFRFSIVDLVASAPCGLDSRGLPVGTQIVGKPLGEEAVLAFGKLMQDQFSIGPPELSALRQEKSLTEFTG